MEKRESFNHAAPIYDEGRPSYPDEVIDWIIRKTKTTRDTTLLKIGAGTGQATMKFAAKGYRIHCIELGRNLADILQQKVKPYPVTVDVSAFEAWEPEHPFKTACIFSATAFHWINKHVKYKKCYDLLEADGFLVLLWNVLPEVGSAKASFRTPAFLRI
jgi:trans-aconitate methyltransferase